MISKFVIPKQIVRFFNGGQLADLIDPYKSWCDDAGIEYEVMLTNRYGAVLSIDEEQFAMFLIRWKSDILLLL
jgi:hypothetical protein